MIETDQTVLIDAAIDRVWNYVRDIRNWADLMPGLRECTVIDANDSRWILKVGVGGLVRTATVLVHVDEWDGPERVNFSYQLEGDPVVGTGAFIASRKAADATDVTLKIRVEGSGPVAPMWEAMCRPLLPQLAKSFAARLKAEIEKADAVPLSQDAVVTDAPSTFAAIGRKLRNLCGQNSRDR